MRALGLWQYPPVFQIWSGRKDGVDERQRRHLSRVDIGRRRRDREPVMPLEHGREGVAVKQPFGGRVAQPAVDRLIERHRGSCVLRPENME